MCKTETRQEAIEYDKDTISFFKSGDKETLVEDLPLEISCLSLTYFLKAGKEETGSWTCCNGDVCCFYKEQNICKYFIKEVTREKKSIQILNLILLLLL